MKKVKSKGKIMLELVRGLLKEKFNPEAANPISLLKSSGLLDPVTLQEDVINPASSDNDLYTAFIQSNTGDMHKWHHYFDVYHSLFARYKNQVGLRVLEIGVKNGGSLRLWREYFDPTALIVGVDIDPTTRRFENPQNNVLVRIGDQADPAFLLSLVREFGHFDILIDDGGHTTNQQITSFLHLYSCVASGGIYLVEDTHTNYWPAFLDREDGLTFIDFAKALTDLLHEPYFGLKNGYPYRMDNPDRLKEIKVSRFCATTSSIAFHDSMVVFEKAGKQFAKNEIR